MARWEFKLPDIGEGVTEGEIVAWHVKAGDVVKEDQPMVDIMTDKATVTITTPRAGRIVETRGSIGTIAAVHSVLVVFELDADAPAAAPEPSKKNGNGNGAAKHEPAATAVGDIKENLPGLGAPPPPRSAPVQTRAAGGGLQGYYNEKPLATPATRKLARDMNVDLRSVPPTGPQGRVTKTDVETYARSGPRHGTEPIPPAIAAEPPMKIARGSVGQEERIPFAGLRRKIAQRMAQSKHTAAHFTFVEEVDATALKNLRTRMKTRAEGSGVKLSYLPFIVKAVVAALKKHPILNSALDETTNEIVLRKFYNIGIAASTDAGLIVPVVKEADKRSLLDIAREIDRVATDAKNGRAKMEDLTGSTFTITSLGAEGGLFATPILNFPEVGILGVHRMKEKPVVRNGQIVIGDVMLLSLSFDHRIVDGHVGAAFAYEVIRYLEEPESLFLEMA